MKSYRCHKLFGEAAASVAGIASPPSVGTVEIGVEFVVGFHQTCFEK